MSDYASLNIRVQSLEAATAEGRLDKLAKTGGKAERATDGLTGSFLRFAGPAAAVAGSLAALTKVTNVTRQFEVLNAQLITSTGSAQNASVAFEALERFAANTPYQLDQAVEGFSKLVNLGLTPSERALTSYGDTASAMGKDLNQMIEAVADAATGEFERLKEFGIKSSKQGDQVKFTFRGVTDTVKFEAGAIEEYLTKLGENNFAGAMSERMQTLDGALSNLRDEWDRTWRNISDQGVGDVIETSVRTATEALVELNHMLSSGQLQANIGAIAGKFDGVGRDVATTLDIVTKLINEASEVWGDDGAAAADFIADAFTNLPENIRALVQIMAVEFGALLDFFPAYDTAIDEVVGAIMVKAIKKAEMYGRALADAANPFSDGSFNLDEELATVDQITDGMIDRAWEVAEEKTAAASAARKSVIADILEERDADVATFKVRLANAKSLREEYDKQRAAQAASQTGDQLAQFKFKPQSGAGDDTGGTGATDKALETLRLSLRTEEEVIQESYDKRLAIILKNTEEGSQQQADLKARLDADFAEQALGGGFESDNSFEGQLEKIQEEYEARRDLILENVALTEEQRTLLEEELTRNRNARMEALENARTSQILQSNSAMFGGLADLAKTFAGEQSGVYKAMFAVSKAFAIADSMMKIQQGIANAASLPWPANLGAIASTVAATAGVVSQIQSTQFAGAFDNGGHIPSGQFGIVGEFGPEIVNGPANVTSRKDTMNMVKQAAEGGGSAPAPAPETNIRIINSVDPSVMEDYMGSSEGERIIMNVVKRNATTVKGMVA